MGLITRQTTTDRLALGDLLWFAGSCWTVVRIHDGFVYGTGGIDPATGLRTNTPVPLCKQTYLGLPLEVTVHEQDHRRTPRSAPLTPEE